MLHSSITGSAKSHHIVYAGGNTLKITEGKPFVGEKRARGALRDYVCNPAIISQTIHLRRIY